MIDLDLGLIHIERKMMMNIHHYLCIKMEREYITLIMVVLVSLKLLNYSNQRILIGYRLILESPS